MRTCIALAAERIVSVLERVRGVESASEVVSSHYAVGSLGYVEERDG